MNLIGQTIQKAIGDKNKLKILTCSTHEMWQTTLCNAFPQYIFYNLDKQGMKTWNDKIQPVPKNCIMIYENIPLYLNFDIIINQNNADQYQLLAPLAKQYNIPLINIIHTNTYPQMSKEYLKYIKDIRGDINIFITKFSRNAWGWSEKEALVIEHGIDGNIFKPNEKIQRKLYILSVCSQFSRQVRWQPCGFPLWKNVIGLGTSQELPWKHLGADDPTFSQPAKNINDLVQNYQTAQIFINPTLLSPLPMSLLEAGSCGCCLISTSTCSIPDVFTHGFDSLLSNDPKQLRKYCIEMLNNPTEARRLGENARKTVQKRFNPERFRNEWAEVFKKAISL